MSSPKEPGWLSPLMIALIGGLAVYGMARGPGNCPFNPPPSTAVESVPMTPESAAADPVPADDGRTLVHADNSNFDASVLQARGPVLVDFYADWCGPCQQLAPVLERVSEELTEGRIVKVNVDENPELASRYNVRALPTLLVFNDGQVVKKSMGFHNESEVRELLKQ